MQSHDASWILAGLALVVMLAACGGATLAPAALPSAAPPSTPLAVNRVTGSPTPAASRAGDVSAGPAPSVSISDARGRQVEGTIDGNALHLSVRLGRPALAAQQVVLRLDGRPAILGRCSVPAGSSECGLSVWADGWAWQNHVRAISQTLVAFLDGADPVVLARKPVAVEPKPVVLIHGFNADAHAWDTWTGPEGFLAQRVAQGYAVGDGRFGTRAMETGAITHPAATTDSLAANAGVLDEYIEAVRRNTGAERVDLVAHSMGGLIARYYIQNLMPNTGVPELAAVPAVNQLYMAGTPNGGTACSRLAAAAGILLPATAQITPEYVRDIFNQAVSDRRGVPFFAIAGNAVRTPIAIRCTEVPTDMVVSVNSVLNNISVVPAEIPAIHTDLNTSLATFERIFASLARSPDDYPIQMTGERAPGRAGGEPLQNTLVKGGTLQVGETTTLTLTIDQARSASFILFAPGSEVSMTIRTVAGKLLTEESPRTNPAVTFTRLQDVGLPVSLGYGVLNPKAGAWDIGLTARKVPPGGGPFALMATLDSDLGLAATAEPGRIRLGDSVQLTTDLKWAARPRQMRVAAQVLGETGQDPNTVLDLPATGEAPQAGPGSARFTGIWRPNRKGEYRVAIVASGADDKGNPFERLVVLAVQVE